MGARKTKPTSNSVSSHFWSQSRTPAFPTLLDKTLLQKIPPELYSLISNYDNDLPLPCLKRAYSRVKIIPYQPHGHSMISSMAIDNKRTGNFFGARRPAKHLGETHPHLDVFSGDGTFLKAVQLEYWSSFNNHLAVDIHGNVVSLSYNIQDDNLYDKIPVRPFRVHVIEPYREKIIFEFDVTKKDPGAVPYGITTDSENNFVLFCENGIWIFSPTGDLLRTIARPSSCHSYHPRATALDRHDNIYSWEYHCPAGPQIHVAKKDGEFVRRIGEELRLKKGESLPRDLTHLDSIVIDGQGNMMILDREPCSIGLRSKLQLVSDRGTEITAIYDGWDRETFVCAGPLLGKDGTIIFLEKSSGTIWINDEVKLEPK